MNKTFAIHRRSILLVLTLATCLHAQPATTQSAAGDLQSAAKPLVDFATWCAANKARSVGEKALIAAKTIVDSPAGLDQVAAALQGATDDAVDSPAVAKARTAAYQSAADQLQAIAAQPHAPADETVFDSYLIKAIRLSPEGRNSSLETAMDRAIAAKRLPSIIDLYATLTIYDPKFAASREVALRDSDQLPAAAKKATAEFLANDQGMLALSYLVRLANVDAAGFAAGKYQPCTDVLAARTFLVRTPAHAMVAYVSIPWKWTPAKPSPVIFCFAGAGKEYKSLCDNYHGVVGDGPYIVVSPVTLLNTNAVNEDGFKQWYTKDVLRPFVGPALNASTIAQRLQFDGPGIVAMVKAIHDAANTEDQIYITGFSGGGLPCYATMISSPSLIAAAAPACANYYLSIPARGRSNGSSVQQFYGENDNFNAAIGNGRGLIAQGREAATVLSQMGYNVIDAVVVPGIGHTAMAQQVVDFFNSTRAAKRK